MCSAKKYKKQIFTFIPTVFLFWAFLLSAAQAHSIYIQSSRYHVSSGKSSPLFFCYGHHIPIDDGVRANKLKYIKIFSPDGEEKMIQIRNETCLHSYMVDYDQPGTFVLAAETNPGYYTVYLDKKGRERHTIKPKDAIIDKAQKITKSLYSNQYTKTYVVCEEPSAQFPARIGLPLELVPSRDISTLKAGENFELEVYYNGKKFEGEGTWDATYNGYSTASEDFLHQPRQVRGGKISVPITRTGRWFIRFFCKTDATGDDMKKFNKMKHTATLVFLVPNEKKNKKEN